MKNLVALAAFLWMAVSAPLQAQSPVVVELFTSQGCSSCPPADKLFHKLAERDDVIALALHVDYWDYIGWKDAFADPAHSARQRGYALEAGRRSIYTPQMIVNGKTDIVGTRPMELSKAIAEYAAMPMPVALGLEREGDEIHVRAEAEMPVEGSLVVYLLRYEPLRSARITRGENAGRNLNYANVTEGWMVVGEWDGATPFEREVEAPGTQPVVVLVQQGVFGPIVGAARLN